MAVTALRKVSKDLPHADIYLNDLWEIEAILLQAYARAMPEMTISFEYEVDNQKITTKDELIAYGGHTSNFTLTLVEPEPYTWSRSLLSFKGFHRPQLDVPSRVGELAWEVQGKIHAVYKDRKKAYKNVAVALPGWTLFAPVLVFLVLDFFLPKNPVFQAKPSASFFLAFSFPVSFFGAYWFALVSKNRLYLQNSREDQRARATLRKERLEKSLWLLLGLILGVIGSLVTNHYKR